MHGMKSVIVTSATTISICIERESVPASMNGL